MILQQRRIIYVPVPKNACSSLKMSLHELETGSPFQPFEEGGRKYNHIHELHFSAPFSHERIARLAPDWKEYFRFCVVRDPIKRFLSAYRNRVLHHRMLSSQKLAQSKLKSALLLPDPSLDYFIMNLEMYRIASWDIMHHTEKQIDFIGQWLDFYDYVCPIEDLALLEAKLSDVVGDRIQFDHLQDGGPKVALDALSEGALRKLYTFYELDYLLLRKYYG